MSRAKLHILLLTVILLLVSFLLLQSTGPRVQAEPQNPTNYNASLWHYLPLVMSHAWGLTPTPTLVVPNPTATPTLTPEPGKLASPTLFDILNSDNNGDFGVSWSSVVDAEYFRLQQRRDNGAWEQIYEGPLRGSGRAGLVDGTYCYRVMALNATTESAWSATKCTTVGIVVSTPTPTSTTEPGGMKAPVINYINNADGDGSYTVSWSSVAGAEEYILREAVNDQPPNDDLVYRGTNTSFGRSNMPKGQHCYRVRGIIVGGEWGPWSDMECTQVSDAPVGLSAPVISSIDNADGDGNYIVQWSSVPGAEEYILREAVNDQPPEDDLVYRGTNTSFSRTNMPKGQHCYRVRGIIVGGEWGPWSETKCASVNDSSGSSDYQCQFVHVGRMNWADAGHELTVFDNGDTLITGGEETKDGGCTDEVYLYDYSSGELLDYLAPLNFARSGHTAVAMSNSEALILGGYHLNMNNWRAECETYHELYSIYSNVETKLIPIPERMQYYDLAAELIDDQYILMVGGGSCYAEYLDHRVIKYDYINDEYHYIDNLTVGGEIFKSDNGKYFISNGDYVYQYDSLTDSVKLIGRTGSDQAYSGGMPGLLGGDRLLITGGRDQSIGDYGEWVDYATIATGNGVFRLSEKLNSPRTSHNSEMLPNGDVVIFNGSNSLDDDEKFLNTIEIYDVSEGVFKEVGTRKCDLVGNNTEYCIEIVGSESTTLPNGLILSAGGIEREFYISEGWIYLDWISATTAVEIVTCSKK